MSGASGDAGCDGPPGAIGKRRRITETVRGTKKEAERVLRERLTAIENGDYVPKQKETVAQFMQRWLETLLRYRLLDRVMPIQI
jgi:hypothetical protein